MKALICAHGVAISAAVLALSCAPTVNAATDVAIKRADLRQLAGTSNTRVTVTDDYGNHVTVHYPPQRIVSLAPAASAMLSASGASGQLVGTIQYSGEPASERKLADVGSAYAIDMERLIALQPDVVVVWPDGNNPAQIATIERLGLPVYRQEAVTLAGIGESLRRLGKLTGRIATAERAARALEVKLDGLRRKYANVRNPPTVLLEVWDRPLYTVGGRELMSDALRVCGTRNVFADLPERAPAIGVEAVLARNPDIIIAAAPPGKAGAWLAQWRRFPSLRAVRTGRLLAFEDQRLSGLGPGVIDATEALCREIASLRARSGAK
jgi:iron complex transport system substrate-binding protein